MTLALTRDDERRLEGTIELLLSPLTHDDVDGWRREVNRSAKVLLRADMASFLLPVPGRASLYSEEIEPDAAQQYPERAPRFRSMSSMWERQLELHVFNRRTLFAPCLDEYYRSEYHNEYIRPNRAHDSLGTSIGLGEEARPEMMATLLFHHDNPRARFGGRGLALLRLLHPAFRAGVGAWQRFGRQRAGLLEMLDRLGEGILLCDRAGRALHRTPALERLLGDEPRRQELEALALRVARRVGAIGGADGLSGLPGSGTAREHVTSVDRYRVEATRVEGFAADPVVLVTIRPSTRRRPAPREIRERFGLTQRQAEVAALLAEGRSNPDVSRRLGISPHTAHHHTEQVLLKLGVGSRAEVASILWRE